MIGRKGFFGIALPKGKVDCLAETYRIEKRPMKWVELFRNVSCEGDMLGQNSSLETKGWGANAIRHGSSPTSQR